MVNIFQLTTEHLADFSPISIHCRPMVTIVVAVTIRVKPSVALPPPPHLALPIPLPSNSDCCSRCSVPYSANTSSSLALPPLPFVKYMELWTTLLHRHAFIRIQLRNLLYWAQTRDRLPGSFIHLWLPNNHLHYSYLDFICSRLLRCVHGVFDLGCILVNHRLYSRLTSAARTCILPRLPFRFHCPSPYKITLYPPPSLSLSYSPSSRFFPSRFRSWF